jgi:hypothetical protein
MDPACEIALKSQLAWDAVKPRSGWSPRNRSGEGGAEYTKNRGPVRFGPELPIASLASWQVPGASVPGSVPPNSERTSSEWCRRRRKVAMSGRSSGVTLPVILRPRLVRWGNHRNSITRCVMLFYKNLSFSSSSLGYHNLLSYGGWPDGV